MSGVFLLLISAIAFTIAYFTYGKYLDHKLGIDPRRKTPAHELKDGIDYVAARKPILFGHHFATIAGGGPIVGPITAAVFGWVPALLWVIVGSIFFGGVHDYASLQASIRHRAQSIGRIIKDYIGGRGQILFLAFAIATIILVVGVFSVLVADTFAATPEAATASILFTFLAIVFGFTVNQLRVNFVFASILGVVIMFFCIWIGNLFPFQLSVSTWTIILLIYTFIACVLPVWLLLQPRDYLNSYLLYGMMAGGFIGILISNPTIQMAGFNGFYDDTLGPLFPILFITIACGAISGFHSLAASGTTAKQLDNEKNGRFITYGGMLIEGFFAVVVIISVAYLTTAEFEARLVESGGAIPTFALGLGHFMTSFGLPLKTGITFISLAASAFLLTSLDSVARVGKFCVQELGEGRNKLLENQYVAAFIVVGGGAILAFSGTWAELWPLFGSANQMLGALALMAVSVWLIKRGINSLFTLIPMVAMFIITISALIVLMYQNFIERNWLLTVSGFILFVLVIFLLFEAWNSFSSFKKVDKDESLHA